MMEFKIIQTKNYLLVVSDAEIKKGDGYLTFKLDETTKWQTSIPDEVKIADLNKTNEFMVLPYSKYCKKIIAHLPLNGAPYLDGVDVLPEFEVDVNNIAEKMLPSHSDFKEEGLSDYQNGRFNGIIEGYNKAKETYKYTEDDLILAYEAGWQQRHNEEGSHFRNREKTIQSLNQPKHPIAFECEADTKIIDSLAKQPYMMIGLTIKSYFKTITNADGRAQWIGTYKF